MYINCTVTPRRVQSQPSPVDSMREAMLTLSPKRQYLGIACPTTPAHATHSLTATMWFLQCSNYCILLHQCRIIGDNVYKMCPDVQNVAVLEENFRSCTYMHLVSYSYVLTVFCCRQQESVAHVSQKMPAILLYVPHTHTTV